MGLYNQKQKNNSIYIGVADNLVKRIKEHNDGKSLYTKKYMQWVLAYVEGYYLKKDAYNRERIIKQFGKVYAQLKRRINNSLDSA